jgi:hypothetical protein
MVSFLVSQREHNSSNVKVLLINSALLQGGQKSSWVNPSLIEKLIPTVLVAIVLESIPARAQGCLFVTVHDAMTRPGKFGPSAL